MTVTVKGSCNPGYYFDSDEQLCRCAISNPDIVRCDTDGRYVYIRVCITRSCMHVCIDGTCPHKIMSYS